VGLVVFVMVAKVKLSTAAKQVILSAERTVATLICAEVVLHDILLW